MRIGFLIRKLSYGGMERQLVELATGLHRRGHQVLVLTMYSGGPLETSLAAAVPVETLGKTGRWDVLPFLRRLIAALRRADPDIVQAYGPFPCILAVLLRPWFRARVIWGKRSSWLDTRDYDPVGRLRFVAEVALARRADGIIVNSNAGMRIALERGFPRATLTTIPNGIDTDRFRIDPEAGRAIRAEWGVGETEQLVGIVARFHPIKDHPTFLRAAAIVQRELPSSRFALIGDGPAEQRRKLHDLVEELGLRGVIWAGNRDDVTAVMNALDVAALTSRGEGFPNVVAEAMACGTPVVVTDVGDAAEIAGDPAHVVAAEDPAAFAGAVLGVLRSPSGGEERKEATRERIVSRFSLASLIEDTERVYLNALKGSSQTQTDAAQPSPNETGVRRKAL